MTSASALCGRGTPHLAQEQQLEPCTASMILRYCPLSSSLTQRTRKAGCQAPLLIIFLEFSPKSTAMSSFCQHCLLHTSFVGWTRGIFPRCECPMYLECLSTSASSSFALCNNLNDNHWTMIHISVKQRRRELSLFEPMGLPQTRKSKSNAWLLGGPASRPRDPPAVGEEVQQDRILRHPQCSVSCITSGGCCSGWRVYGQLERAK